jgi:hypothetical protein
LFGKVFFDFHSFTFLFFMYILLFCASGAPISRLSASVKSTSPCCVMLLLGVVEFA